MTENRLEEEYFEWMYNLVCGIKKVSYRKLLYFLHSVPFYYLIEMDDNRAGDGVSLRYRFGNQMGYHNSVIATYLDNRECSVLEMMVALANRIEESIMDNPEFGDRTGEWFFSMLGSLQISNQNDDIFDAEYVGNVVKVLLERIYEPNGLGGLFTLERPRRDMRGVEIWMQAMWYLDEYIEEH